MNKLRVAKKNEYVIEVNDAGDTISFNMEDPTLILRLEKTFESIQGATNRLKAEMLVLEKKQDSKPKGKLLTDKSRASLQLYNSCFDDMRKAMDEFLGKGACQKIFGDTNYLSMFDDLIAELQPHFERMGISHDAFFNAIKKKYGDSEDGGSTLEA